MTDNAVARDSFPIVNHSGMPDSDFDELARTLGEHRSIKNALDWIVQQTPDCIPPDAIAQDEYSHDIVFRYRADYWLAFECT